MFILKFLGVTFGLESSAANNKFYFGKSWDPTEVSLSGKIYNYMVVCNLLGFDKFDTWRMLPLLDAPKLYSFYLIDLDNQSFTNYGEFGLQPILYRGTDDSVESTKDPTFANSLIEIRSGQQLTQGPINYRMDSRVTHTTTHWLKIRLLAYPAASLFGDLISFVNDKKIKIQVSSSGGLRVQSSSTIYDTTGITMGVNTWYWVRITLVRGIMEHHFFDCSIGIEVLGLGEEGTTFKCSQIILFFFNYQNRSRS